MKIMFCTSSMGKGGAERVISILSNSFINDNEVSILVNTDKNIAYELDKKIEVIPLDKKYYKNNLIRNIYRIIQTKRILEKEKPDIIISFLPMPSFRVLLANKKFEIPVIISDRNDPKQEYKSKISSILMNCLYPKANGFLKKCSPYAHKDETNVFTYFDVEKADKYKGNPNVKVTYTIDGTTPTINSSEIVDSLSYKFTSQAPTIKVHVYRNEKLVYLDYYTEGHSYVNDEHCNDSLAK